MPDTSIVSKKKQSLTVKKEQPQKKAESKKELSTLCSPVVHTKAKKPSQISLQSKVNGLSERNKETKVARPTTR